MSWLKDSIHSGEKHMSNIGFLMKNMDAKLIMRLTTSDDCSSWKNAPDTGELDASNAGCASWREFWEKFSGDEKWPNNCQHEGCKNNATDGAHIVKAIPNTRFGKQVYIVPFCKEHNPRTPKTENPCFDLKLGTVIVRANVEMQRKSETEKMREIINNLHKED